MQVSEFLAKGFDLKFQGKLLDFCQANGLLTKEDDPTSHRFLSRSITPHIKKLSGLFNRSETEQIAGIDAKYWKQSSNPDNLRLAYFLYYMPANLFRMASICSELRRHGYTWPIGRKIMGVDFGSGPASAVSGFAASNFFDGDAESIRFGRWALIDQNNKMLELARKWSEFYINDHLGFEWDFATYFRKLEFKKSLLPAAAPSFNLMTFSYVLNEQSGETSDIKQIASNLVRTCENHLEEDGLVIILEPALKDQSRKVLQLRKELLKLNPSWLKILLPCFNNHDCGALSSDDWCHEQVSWWRPPYYVEIDKLAELDHKTLPFSYLVFSKTQKQVDEILVKIKGDNPNKRFRIVSPAHKPTARGRDVEFFACGVKGKYRARLNSQQNIQGIEQVGRGSVLIDADITGDIHATRVQSVRKIL